MIETARGGMRVKRGDRSILWSPFSHGEGHTHNREGDKGVGAFLFESDKGGDIEEYLEPTMKEMDRHSHLHLERNDTLNSNLIPK